MLRIGFTFLLPWWFFMAWYISWALWLTGHWPGLAELPYKTTLLGEHWSWVHPACAFTASCGWLWLLAWQEAAITLLTGHSWWLPVMLFAVVVSLIITLLDWGNAFRGAIISFVILVPLLLIFGLRIQPRPFYRLPRT